MLKNMMIPAPAYMLRGRDGQVILGQPAGGTIFTNDLYGGKPGIVSSMAGLFSSLGSGGPYGPSNDPTEDPHHQAPKYVLDIHNYNPGWVKTQLVNEGWDKYFGVTPDFLLATLARQNVSPQQSWWALIRGKYGPKPQSPVDCSSVPRDISWQNLRAFGESVGISNFKAWNGESAYEAACRLLHHRQIMAEAQAQQSGPMALVPALPIPGGASMTSTQAARAPVASTTMNQVIYPSPSVDLRSQASGTMAPPAGPSIAPQPMAPPPPSPVDTSSRGGSDDWSNPIPFDGRGRPMPNVGAERMVIQNIWEEIIVSFFSPDGNLVLPSMVMTPAIENVIKQNMSVLRVLASGDMPDPGDESPQMRMALIKIAAVMMTDAGVRAIMQSEKYPVASYYAKLATQGTAPIPAEVPSKRGNMGLLIGAGVVGLGVVWFLINRSPGQTPEAG